MLRRPPISPLFPYTTLFRSPLHPEYREPRAGDVRHSRADISRARALLGYEPSVGFREGLARTIESLIAQRDRKSTRLNSSHMSISYAVFCLKKKKNKRNKHT